jgi:hypothetical protein
MKKKSEKDIKKELQELIGSMDDANALHEDAAPYITRNHLDKLDTTDGLTPEQEKGLDEAIKQVNQGDVVDWEEYLKATGRWRTK